MTRNYRGYRYHRTPDGNYWASVFGSGYLACNLVTLKRWIDQAIASGEISRVAGQS